MRILWVAQWFPPDLGALPARLTEMARVWTEAGHDVTVLTAFPHHPLGVVPEAYRGKWTTEERYEGLRVIRCRLWALPNRRLWQRTLCQVSFAMTSVLLALHRPRRPDVVIVSSPPFFTVPAGLLFARRHRARFVFEVRDLWPDVLLATGSVSRGLVHRLLERAAMAFYRAADRVVVVTRSFERDLLDRGIAQAALAVVPNGADLDFYGPRSPSPDLRRRLGGEGKFLVTFVGTHGLATGLEQILDAAELLRQDPGFAFALVGEGARKDALIAEARRRGLTNAVFHPALPKAAMPELYASTDACVVCLRPLPLFQKVIPSKIFEILACGRPLVAALAGEAADIVRAAGGRVTPPGDGAALAGALREVRDAGPARAGTGRAYVAAHFDRRELAKRYLAILESIAAPPR